jgi:DNA-binding beta-propeller fold protein YncE
MVADETKNDGDVFYAVSTDDRTSWGVIKDGDGVRKIAKNNSGTWQYNNDAGSSTVVGYDLSNSATLNKTLSYNSQEASGGGMAFNNDGTKLYLIGEQNNLIHEYTLSTAYDISTSSYNSVTFDPSILSAIDIKWKPDGTKVYIMDYDSSVRGTIYTFNVSTAWDITTASSASETFRGNAQDSSLVKFAFKTDGTRLYKLGRQGNRIHAYDLSTAWDVSSASYASEELPMGNVVANSTVGTSMNGLAFNSSGTKVFVAVYHSTNTSNNRIYEIDLSTAWDIGIDNNGNGNYAGVYLNTDRVVNVLFNGDGSQVYAMNAATDTISSYSSGTASIVYGTSETWVNGTNNNEHATLQEALGAQSFNRMDKAQLQAVTDPNHYVLGDTLDLMIAPYAASGTSPLSDGVTIGYQADALIKQAINGTDYEAEFPATNKVKIKSLAAQNLKIRII